MRLLERLHERQVFPRRVQVLSGHLASLIPEKASVLDLGAGDGSLAQAILRLRPDVEIRGLDVTTRPRTAIAVESFDGRTIPTSDRSFEAVLLVDVLHHASEPEHLLEEAVRVARQFVLVKDHLSDSFLATATLTMMDCVGNARHGVAVTGRYWTKRQWHEAFQRLGVDPDTWIGSLGLYPRPASWVFERSLHFLARLRRRGSGTNDCR